jgi:hypothetical protein
MLKKITALLALGAPLAAGAAEPLTMACDISTRSFFEPLVQNGLIKTKPFKVAAHSINYFQPRMFKHLTVYGMPVTFVFGYADDPLLFINNGEKARPIYGVIVREGIANVQAQLKAVGADRAMTFRVDSNSTMIGCKGEEA